MSTSHDEVPPVAAGVEVTETHLRVHFEDGRRLEVPLAWLPRLRDARPKQRRRWRLLGDGSGIRWPELDEDVSVTGLLAGRGATVRPDGDAA